ncbi:MAG: helix-turn-helix domain-containing protein [Cyclobacteriaceae bacterium]|jgi:AraC-like DNA-binding protein|nr:AraC family transcriptional regulator [Flammeovirgaceae bacterium]
MNLGIQAIVSSWLDKVKKHLFTYRDGFYELPYIANSPELIVASFSSFLKHDPKRKIFSTNNIFINGEGHYEKIEEGLWIILSNFEAKKNLSFKLHYEPGIESNYHSLTLYINKDIRQIKFPKVIYGVPSQDRSWMLVKAGAQVLNSHFKGQKSIFFTIYFSRDWMVQNIAGNGIFKNQILTNFFDSDRDSVFLPNFLEGKRETYLKLVNSIIDKDENGVNDLLLLRSQTLELLSAFVNELTNSSLKVYTVTLPERDKRRLAKAEHLINDSIFNQFPSLGKLASEAGISETKLLADFKRMYGCTPYRYYVAKQMAYAKEMMQTRQVTVKEIALKLGFQHAGKFSAAYKKIHGHSPSEVM